MAGEPFLRPLADGRFQPTAASRGPWSPASMHARVIAGLFAHDLETRWTEPGFRCARLTLDLYRLPTLAPGAATARVLRDGNRIRVVELEYTSEEKSYARGTAVLLRTGEEPAGKVWSPPPWDAPAPEAITAPDPWNHGDDPMFEVRGISGRDGSGERPRAWLRERRPLIEGIELTPLVRAALASDLTNPFANSGSEGLQFINADITLSLHRYPEGEWVGFDTIDHQSADGITTAECALYDERRPVGRSSVCAIANGRAGGS